MPPPPPPQRDLNPQSQQANERRPMPQIARPVGFSERQCAYCRIPGRALSYTHNLDPLIKVEIYGTFEKFASPTHLLEFSHCCGLVPWKQNGVQYCGRGTRKTNIDQ